MRRALTDGGPNGKARSGRTFAVPGPFSIAAIPRFPDLHPGHQGWKFDWPLDETRPPTTSLGDAGHIIPWSMLRGILELGV